jgi:hypothetical protein
MARRSPNNDDSVEVGFLDSTLYFAQVRHILSHMYVDLEILVLAIQPNDDQLNLKW